MKPVPWSSAASAQRHRPGRRPLRPKAANVSTWGPRAYPVLLRHRLPSSGAQWKRHSPPGCGNVNADISLPPPLPEVRGVSATASQGPRGLSPPGTIFLASSFIFLLCFLEFSRPQLCPLITCFPFPNKLDLHSKNFLSHLLSRLSLRRLPAAQETIPTCCSSGTKLPVVSLRGHGLNVARRLSLTPPPPASRQPRKSK